VSADRGRLRRGGPRDAPAGGGRLPGDDDGAARQPAPGIRLRLCGVRRAAAAGLAGGGRSLPQRVLCRLAAGGRALGGRMETGPESRAENRRGPSAAPAPSPGLSPEFAPALAPERTPGRASERSSEQAPELSVVAPVYNEEESVSHFVAELE